MRSTENTTSAIHKKTNDLFGILLIIVFVICILLLLAIAILYLIGTERDLLGTTMFSSTGVTGSAILYMKWDVIRRSQLTSTDAKGIGSLLNKSKSETNGE